MENEPESITQVRVRMYREALAELREENELAERKAERTKEAEAQSEKKADAKMAKGGDETRPDRDRSGGHGSSDKA